LGKHKENVKFFAKSWTAAGREKTSTLSKEFKTNVAKVVEGENKKKAEKKSQAMSI
jgi:hypothetical protein